MSCPRHHRAGPAAARVHLDSCLFADLLENCAVPGATNDAEALQEVCFLLSRQGTRRTGPVSPRPCSHGSTIHTVGALYSVAQLLCSWDLGDIEGWCKYTGLASYTYCIVGNKNHRVLLMPTRKEAAALSLFSMTTS